MNCKNCLECGSDKLFHISDDSALCMDCKTFHEIYHKEVDGLSWWLWQREYKKICKS